MYKPIRKITIKNLTRGVRHEKNIYTNAAYIYKKWVYFLCNRNTNVNALKYHFSSIRWQGCGETGTAIHAKREDGGGVGRNGVIVKYL